MKKFAPNTSLWTVAHCKEFRPFKKYIINPRVCRVIMQVYKIKNLRWFYPLDATVTANSLNEMRERIKRGEELYHAFGSDVGVYSFLIRENRPFVLVLPGGGYGDVCSLIEGFSIAIRLNELGFNAFIGQYSVGKKAHYPNPQNNVATVLNYIFDNAKKLKINPDNYAILGCSAGGHLAASWGTKIVGYKHYGLPKPQALMLAYPVITMGEFTHRGSRKYLLGKEYNNLSLQEKYSVEKQVDGNYPKTYVWQCKNDKVVPYKNSLLLIEALKNNGVEYEHFAVDGTAHGWGLATKTAADGWLEKAVEFWQE